MQTRAFVFHLASAVIGAACLCSAPLANAEATGKLMVPAGSADETCHPAVKPCRPVETYRAQLTAVPAASRDAPRASDANTNQCHPMIAPCKREVADVVQPTLSANQ